MKSTKALFLFVGLAAVLLAADPYAGNWKLNIAKSKYTTGSAPKASTVAITEKGADMDIVVTTTPVTGAPITFHYTTPLKGGDGKVVALTGSTAYDGVSSKRIADNEREITYTKAGKAVYNTHSTISKDGKTMTIHAKGTNAMGQTIDAEAVYEK